MIYDETLGATDIRCLVSNRAISVTGGKLEIIDIGEVRTGITIEGGAFKVIGELQLSN